MKNPPSNSDDIVDSRDVIDRIDKLEGIDGIEDDDAKELVTLRALRDEAEGYAPDWKYGAALIRRSHWPEYARQLVADVGDMPKDIPSYIADNINWDGVAKDLEVDYTTVDFDGVEYLIR